MLVYPKTSIRRDTRGVQPNVGPTEKRVDVVQFVRDGRGRQRLQKPLPVRLGAQTWIQYGQHTSIVAMSDQASQSLLEGEDGKWHLVVGKRVAAAELHGLHTRGRNRIAGRRKR